MLYEYHCHECGENFEIKATLEQKEKKDSEIFFCPVCKSKNIEQVIKSVNCSTGGSAKKSGCCPHGGCGCF